jgi:transcriptional regulator with XRE-family HTH domain
VADELKRAWLAEVGLRIRVARIRRRQSQERLVQLPRVSRVTLGSVERGDHSAGVLTYVRLARTLGVSQDELLSDAP